MTTQGKMRENKHAPNRFAIVGEEEEKGRAPGKIRNKLQRELEKVGSHTR